MHILKNTAVARIIIYSVVVILLIGVLLVGLFTDKIGFFGNFSFDFSGISYKNADLYKSGNVELSPDKISNLNINWISGSVKISTHAGDKILVTEANSESFEDENKLHYYVNDSGTLYVQFAALRNFFSTIGWKEPSKNLSVLIPENRSDIIKSLKAKAVSADIWVDKVTAQTIELEAVSGKITAESIGESDRISAQTVSGGINVNARTRKIDFETTSGDIRFDGQATDRINSESVSGKVEIYLADTVDKVNIETISGSISIALSENCGGFKARHESVSGSFRCEFPTTETDDDESVYSDGSADFRFETVSGSITIKKK